MPGSTSGYTFATLPLAPIKKLTRDAIPSRDGTPNARSHSPLGSATIGNGRFCSFENSSCDLASSSETPNTCTLASLNLFQESRNAHASLVQPGVPSFG